MRPMAVRLTIVLVAGICLLPFLTHAEERKIPRIGYLSPASRSGSPHLLEAFLQGLRDLGYVDGESISIEYRWAEGKTERLAALAADLVRLPVDVMVTSATPATRAAKKSTDTIPVVMIAVGDPVGSGLVISLAQPSGNVTGLATLIPELSAKRLELLKEALPGISRVAVLFNPANPVKPLDWQETAAAAQRLGVRLQPLEVSRPEDLEPAFTAMVQEETEELITFPDPVTIQHRERIVELAVKHRLPAMYGLREFTNAGGLMAYGVSFPDLYQRAATFVDKILKGASPTDLPVEQPIRFELVVNLKAAKALGLTLPPSFLFRADNVMQ